MKQDIIDSFCHARFGMFLHWGIYSILGGRWQGKTMDYIGEWVQAYFRIPNQEYASLATQFNPILFNADEWVRTAKEAGMKYIVFTAKHHDGFAMYHSHVSRYNIVDATPFGRDVLKELASACEHYDIKLGIYYSHCLDWSDPDGADPGPASPKNFGMSWGNDWDYTDIESKNFSRYFENKAKKQITELLTEYGPIFLLWFDCPLVITQEQSADLRRLVHSIQPDCLINSRVGHNLGDFGSLGDNQYPTGQVEFPMESANTMNHTWGFKWDDHRWMGARDVVCNLANFSDKNVNCLLNVGPRPDGRFPDASSDILREVSCWRRISKVVVQNTRPNPFPQSFPWGWCTVIGNTLQLFVRDRHQKELWITGIRNKIVSCDTPFSQQGENLKISSPENDFSILPVIRIEFEGDLDVDQRFIPQNGTLELVASKSTICHGALTELIGIQASLGAAAEAMHEEQVCYINNGGSLTQWHHPGDGASWVVYFPVGGKYKVSAITENRRLNAAWVSAGTVEVAFAEQSFQAPLHLDEDISSSYYTKGLSEIGSLVVSAGESGTISIKRLKINAPASVDMNLTAIILKSI